jgi:hypothetical protein
MLKKSFFFSCVLLLAASQYSLAAMLTQTQYFDIESNLNGTFTFNQFNSHGQLRSIAILFCLQTTDGRLILDNDGAHSASGLLQFGAKGSINSTDVVLLNSSYMPVLKDVLAVNEQAFSLSPDDGDGLSNFDSSSPDGLLCVGSPQMDTESGIIGQAFWSLGSKGFLGTGTFNLNYSIMQLVNYGGINNISYAVNTVDSEGYITLIYNYQPAPESATILFFSLGMLIFRFPQRYVKTGIKVK